MFDKGGARPEARFSALLVTRDGDSTYPRTLHLKLFCDGGELYLDLDCVAGACQIAEKDLASSAPRFGARCPRSTVPPRDAATVRARLGAGARPRARTRRRARRRRRRNRSRRALRRGVRGLALVRSARVSRSLWLAWLSPLWMRRRPRTFGGVDAAAQTALLERLLKHRVYTVRMAVFMLKLSICTLAFGDESTLARDRRLQADDARAADAEGIVNKVPR